MIIIKSPAAVDTVLLFSTIRPTDTPKLGAGPNLKWCNFKNHINATKNLGGFNMNAIIPMRRMVIISTLSFHEVVKYCNALEGKSLMMMFFVTK